MAKYTPVEIIDDNEDTSSVSSSKYTPVEVVDDSEQPSGELPETDTPPSELESAGRGALQEGTFGLADEISGAGEAAWESITGKDKLSDLLDNYKKYRDESRMAFGEAERVNPKSYMAGQVVGGIGSTLAGGALLKGANLAAKGASALSKIGTATKAGIAYGAAQGYGRSKEDSIVGDVKETIKGGVIGGVKIKIITLESHCCILG